MSSDHPDAVRLYQLWSCTAEVMIPGPKFRTAADAMAFADSQADEQAIQRPDGSWLRPPPAPPLEELDARIEAQADARNRRQFARYRVYMPGRVELTPGRMDASRRERVPTFIVDAGAAGLRLDVSGNSHRLKRNDLIRVLFSWGPTTVELPGRVVWCAGESIGVHFKLIDRQLKAEYENWLAAIAGAGAGV